MDRSPLAICLVGLRGSGKSAAAHIFAKYGFRVVSAGKTNAELAESEGWPSTNVKDLQDFGYQFLLRHGPNHFASILSKKAQGASWVIFDGIRSPAVITGLLKDWPELRILQIDTRADVRQYRLLERGSAPSLDTHPVESLSEGGFSLPVSRIRNEGTYDELEQAVISFLRTIETC